MTDLFAEQSEIRARHRPIRDKSGQFRRPGYELEIRIARDRMTSRLKSELDAADHAAGRVRVHPHFRPLPNADKLALVQSPTCVLPLFERAA